jgi:hypothetical protein
VLYKTRSKNAPLEKSLACVLAAVFEPAPNAEAAVRDDLHSL